MLILRDLVKVYPGPVTALQGIHLEIPNGMFGLLGPNGAGKSTLMRIVAGILEPTSGTVTLDAIDVVREPDRVRAQLGYLPQTAGPTRSRDPRTAPCPISSSSLVAPCSILNPA
jgi:ABC-type multidrug transport system ATPase subunit